MTSRPRKPTGEKRAGKGNEIQKVKMADQFSSFQLLDTPRARRQGASVGVKASPLPLNKKVTRREENFTRKKGFLQKERTGLSSG